MCLTLKFNTRAKARDCKNNPLIAKRNIIVYKLLYYSKVDKTLKSPYNNYLYNPGEWLYQTGDKKFTFIIDRFYSTWYLDILRGLYSYSDIRIAKKELNHTRLANRLYEMIIPKGSQYYINKDTGEIVSDNLIFPWDSKPIK